MSLYEYDAMIVEFCGLCNGEKAIGIDKWDKNWCPLCGGTGSPNIGG